MKSFNSIMDLAINGAAPLYEKELYVGYPNIGDRQYFIQCINDIFDRSWLSNNGHYLKTFETELKKYLNVKHVIPVCNATVGLEIAAKALGLKGEVIVPSFTFIATAHILQWMGIKPVFCDIEENSHTIDCTQIRKLITNNTSGILGVHLWGNLCDTEELGKIAKENNLKLLFDAAHAFGSSDGSTMAGNFGDCEVFSFHATKIFNSFEGGAITTNNDELAEKIRLMINFGFKGYDNVVEIGLNAKMNEACAAMGLTNLKDIYKYIEKARNNQKLYIKYLSKIDGIRVVTNYSEKNNGHYVVIEVDEKKFGIPRDRLYNILHKENIIVRRYFYPGCHRMEPYKTIYPHADKSLPTTNDVGSKVLVLPNNRLISEKEIVSISNLINFCYDNRKFIQ